MWQRFLYHIGRKGYVTLVTKVLCHTCGKGFATDLWQRLYNYITFMANVFCIILTEKFVCHTCHKGFVSHLWTRFSVTFAAKVSWDVYIQTCYSSTMSQIYVNILVWPRINWKVCWSDIKSTRFYRTAYRHFLLIRHLKNCYLTNKMFLHVNQSYAI